VCPWTLWRFWNGIVMGAICAFRCWRTGKPAAARWLTAPQPTWKVRSHSQTSYAQLQEPVATGAGRPRRARWGALTIAARLCVWKVLITHIYPPAACSMHCHIIIHTHIPSPLVYSRLFVLSHCSSSVITPDVHTAQAWTRQTPQQPRYTQRSMQRIANKPTRPALLS